MAERKLKKGFNFTIDSLLKSSNEVNSRKERFNSVILPEMQDGCYPSTLSSTIPEFKYCRADEELSEYSDTSDRISPILSPESYTLTTGSNNQESSEDLEERCSPPYTNQSAKPRHSSSPFSAENSPDNTNIRHKKKSRTAFTNEQLDQLEKRFQSHRYLAVNERSELAEELKLTDQKVKTWFQNRRMKEKRQLKMKQTSGISFPTGGVDVMQVRALGIPCPLPPGQVTVSSYSNHSLPSVVHNFSQMTLPYLSSMNQVHPSYLPQYGYQYGFNQLSIPHIGATYPVL